MGDVKTFYSSFIDWYDFFTNFALINKPIIIKDFDKFRTFH